MFFSPRAFRVAAEIENASFSGNRRMRCLVIDVLTRTRWRGQYDDLVHDFL
jgi:hypothetical protein